MNSVLFNGISDFVGKGINGDNILPVPTMSLKHYDEVFKALNFTMKEFIEVEEVLNGWKGYFTLEYNREDIKLLFTGSLWEGDYQIEKLKNE